MKSKKIIDTNVLLAANGDATHISIKEQEKCFNFLKTFREVGCFVLDQSGEVLYEYRKKLQPKIHPYGNAILKYIIDHQAYSGIVFQINITKCGNDWYSEIDNSFKTITTDVNDRKFIAIHHASGCAYPIVNATDSDWKKLKQEMKNIGIMGNLLLIEELL